MSKCDVNHIDVRDVHASYQNAKYQLSANRPTILVCCIDGLAVERHVPLTPHPATNASQLVTVVRRSTG